MNTQFFIAVLAGTGGMIGWGFSEFAAKKSVDAIGTISSLVWAHVFGTILLFALLLSRTFVADVPTALFLDSTEWLGLLFFGALQAVVYYFAYKGFEKGQVSILSPIFASFAGMVALLSVLVFGEALTVLSALALAIIFGGVILINLNVEDFKAGRIRIKTVAGLREILIATILATMWTLGWDRFSGGKDWMLYTTCMFVGMTITAFFIARLANVNLWEVKPGAWKFLWLIAIGEVVAYLAITLGYASTTYTSIVAILSGASSLPTIILAQIFLKERMTRIQAVSSLIIIGGIVLLSLS